MKRESGILARTPAICRSAPLPHSIVRQSSISQTARYQTRRPATRRTIIVVLQFPYLGTPSSQPASQALSQASIQVTTPRSHHATPCIKPTPPASRPTKLAGHPANSPRTATAHHRLQTETPNCLLTPCRIGKISGCRVCYLPSYFITLPPYYLTTLLPYYFITLICLVLLNHCFYRLI